MRLPHAKEMHYAKELLKHEEQKVEVKVLFPQLPTLAMFIEAAAQSSSAFQEGKSAKMGFVSMVQDVKLLEEIGEKAYLFKVTKEAEIGAYTKFFFEAYEESSTLQVVTGWFTLVIA